ncbi:MAG TPA: hypothetical protein VOA87_18280 [Thermoanaerobaculia bacterium]|nr:hypothetical protein [Thermoanaerobaculia bacterium]
MAELTGFCWRAAKEAVRRARPEATARELDAFFLSERYGDEVAEAVVSLKAEKGFYG